MKAPRDIGGRELATALQRYGYGITRQTGSHIRLTTSEGGEHHITIPGHRALRIGTLSSILGEVADHFGRDKSDIADDLWG
jgi:predicted RNA binding protein YcfA (HicA-like mRNA interferase family)